MILIPLNFSTIEITFTQKRNIFVDISKGKIENDIFLLNGLIIFIVLWMCVTKKKIQRLLDYIFIVININIVEMIFYDLNLDLSIEKQKIPNISCNRLKIHFLSVGFL